MRKELNIFVDPRGGTTPLDLKIIQKEKGHVVSGELYHKNCSYPIIRGIPRFVEKNFYQWSACKSFAAQTVQSFGRKWNQRRSKRLGHARSDINNLREQFMAVLGCSSELELKRLLKNTKTCLNAGCGVAWGEYLFNYNPHTSRHCIDISLSVETAFQKTREFKNVTVSQASIFELPYQDGIFDVIYSIGVIHHTANPQKAFNSLVSKLAKGGIVGIYIYNFKPLLREIADTAIRKITSRMDYDNCMKFSKSITHLGKSLSKITQPLVIHENIKILDIKKGRYNLHKFIYDHFLKCWYNHKADMPYADSVNQDWYHPHYASHHGKDEVVSWFRKAGIRIIQCVQPKGWEHSGYFISGRKI